jgi:hypothetical protein
MLARLDVYCKSFAEINIGNLLDFTGFLGFWTAEVYDEINEVKGYRMDVGGRNPSGNCAVTCEEEFPD